MLPGSLGPKPTVKQMEYLRILADGYELRYSTGIRFNGYAHYVKPGNPRDSIKARTDTHLKFEAWGWIEQVRGDCNGTDYRITENGRKVVEKGETRK